MKPKDKTALIGYDKGGNRVFTCYVSINIFTYIILEQVYYTKTGGGVVAFNTHYLYDILDIVTTDPYYQCCRHCERFKECLTGEYNGECERGYITPAKRR